MNRNDAEDGEDDGDNVDNTDLHDVEVFLLNVLYPPNEEIIKRFDMFDRAYFGVCVCLYALASYVYLLSYIQYI